MEARRKQNSPPPALDAAELARLDRDGFLVLTGVVADAQLAELRALVQATGGSGKHDDPLEGEVYERVWRHPRVHAAVVHLLGDDFEASVAHRTPAPGHGRQSLHVDWGSPVPPGAYQVCNAFLALVPFTEENGATRVVPGTHAWGRLPPDEPTPGWRHPGERRLIGPAGTLFVVNGHLWHSGMRNDSSAPRAALVVRFGRRGRRAKAP